MTRARIATLLLIGLASCAIGTNPPPGAATVDGAIAIFGKLGLPSIKGKRFVRLNTGRPWTDGRNRLRFSYVTGWLLSGDDPGEVDLLTPGLHRLRLKRDRALPSDWEKRRADHPADMPLPGELADVDFEQFARGIVAGHGEWPDLEPSALETDGVLPRSALACLLAFWAQERGDVHLATKLADAAGSAFDSVRARSHGHEVPETLETAVATAVAENLRRQAIVHANEGAPFESLLREWKLIAVELPGTSWTDEAKSMVASYGSVIAEEAEWHEPSPGELAKAPPAERATYWIHRLRDLGVRGNRYLGVVVLGPFSGLGDGETNPAEELVKLRWDAVPALIEHLTDVRPTRSMGGRWPVYLATIGDCCQSAFEAITGEEIYRKSSVDGIMTRDGRARMAQKIASDWWERVKDKGERRYLTEAVSSGDPERVGICPHLVSFYPDDAFAAIKAGISRASDERAHAWLVAQAAKLERDDPTELLEAEAKPDRPLLVRIVATEGLLRRGKRAAVTPMIAAWERLSPDSRETSDSLLALLLGSGVPEAIRAIGRDLPRRPPTVRVAAITSLAGEVGFVTAWPGVPTIDVSPAREAEGEDRSAWDTAVEDVLVSALADESERPDLVKEWSERGFSDPRVCDLAANGLAQRWPDRYSFDLRASIADRDHQRSQILDSYGRFRGLEPRADAWPAVATEDRARLDAALDAFCKGDAPGRSKAGGELEAIGVGGLAAIETRIAALGAAPPSRELQAVAIRVSCTVVAAVASSDVGEVAEAVRSSMTACRGTPLTGAAFVELLTTAAGHCPAETRMLEALAERASDGSGVFVKLAFRKDAGPRNDVTHPVESLTRVALGREATVQLVGGGTAKCVSTPESHEALRSALDRCLTSPGRTPFIASVKISFFPEPISKRPPVFEGKSDARGDPLPEHARARYGSMRFRHAAGVECVAWAPDGKTIVSGSGDKTVRVWDAATGRELRRLEGHTWYVGDVAVSPDGKLAASAGSDKTLRVWDLATGASRFAITQPGILESVAFSPDGQTLAAGCSDGVVRFYRPGTGVCVRAVRATSTERLDVVAALWLRVQFLDAETVAVAGIDDSLRFIRGETMRVSPPLGRRISRIGCSLDGKRIAAAGSDRTIVLYDVATEKVIRSFPLPSGESGSPFPIAFSPDGKVIASGDPDFCCVHRWEAETGKELDDLEGIHSQVEGLAFSCDGKRLAGGGDDQEIHVWDAGTGKCLSGPSGFGDLLAIALSPDGKTLVVGDRGSRLLFLDPESLELRREVRAETGVGLAFSPDGKHLVGGFHGTASVWDGSTGALEHGFTLEPSVQGAAFSPDGDTFAISAGDATHVFSLSRMKDLRSLRGGGSVSLAFSPDGRLLAKSSFLFGAAILDVASWEERWVLDEPSGICAFAFSPDGRILATGSQGANGARATLWDRSTEKRIRTIEMNEDVRCLAFSPDSARLAIGCQGVGQTGAKSLGIWEVSTGERLVDFVGHAAMISGVVFSRDGRMLFSASADGTVLAWDMPDKAR